MKRSHLTFLACLLLTGFLNSCTVFESRKYVTSHVAVGIADQDEMLGIDFGSSPGSLLELNLWWLLRLEIGWAGASAGVGPLHAGVGILSYSPSLPPMLGQGNNPGASYGLAATAKDSEEAK